jgi:hypothetical protein
MCDADIAAANYSHVGYFPRLADCDIFFAILLRVADIAVLTFALLAQKLLVDFLCAQDDQSADWYEEFWTGARGRYCLCPAGHSGSNNNTEVKIDWCDMKKQCPPLASLRTFLSALSQFIRQLGLEHCDHLEQQGTPKKFIIDPVLSNAMWDRLQEMHSKTLSCPYIYKGRGKTLATKFHDIVHDIMETSEAHTPLHLKIKAWHKGQKRSGELKPP